MPSLLFHAAVAGLLASALLQEEFGPRSLAFVVGVTLLVDLDTLVGLYWAGAHRSLLHNVFFASAACGLLLWDYRTGGPVSERLGGSTPAVAAVSLVAAGVAPDLFWNGVNLFYPVQDRFYEFSGEMFLSLERGVVQDIFDLAGFGSTETVHFSTGFDPSPGEEVPGAERKFMVAGSGIQFLVTSIGLAVSLYRLRKTGAGV